MAARVFTFASPRARAIVPYIARQSPRWARQGGRLVRRTVKRSPIASVLGGYTAGTMIPRYAGTKRAWKSYQSYKNRAAKRTVRRRVGEPVNKSNAKANQDENYVGLNTKTLYQQPLLDIPSTTDSSSTTQRLRDKVNFRGIKFCINWLHTSDAIVDWRLHCHIAIISPKNGGSPSVNQFFRSQGSTTSRAVDFSTALSGMDLACNPINPDQYNIHKHKRFTLAPTQSNGNGKERMHTFYMPLNRSITYDVGISSPLGKNMFLVYWCSYADELGGAAARASAAVTQVRLVKYFREPIGT